MAFGPKPWKDKPDGTTPISAAAMIDLEARLAAYTDSHIVQSGATLPTTPAEGEQFDLLFADGLYRRCTWRGAANGGLGAWIVAGGGPPITASQSAAGQMGSTSLVRIPNTPKITVAHSGRYWARADGSFRQANAAISDVLVVVSKNGVSQGLVAWTTQGSIWIGGSIGGQTSPIMIAANDEIEVMASASNTAVWDVGAQHRWHLALHPIEFHP